MTRIVSGMLGCAALLLSAGATRADGPANRSSYDAPVTVAPVKWGGISIAGGIGFGLWTASEVSTATTAGVPSGCGLCTSKTVGGQGNFGTIGLGYDHQFWGNYVVGTFLEADIGKLKGTLQDQVPGGLGVSGGLQQDRTYALGVRGGVLVVPNVLTYATAGLTRAHFSAAQLAADANPALTGATPAFSKNGWFLGSGVQMMMTGGWSWKSEYRLASYGTANLDNRFALGGVPSTTVGHIQFRPIEQTVRTELVYKFPW